MSRRGQLVLVAAVVAAMALVPALAAYLQLGYHDDVRAGGDYTHSVAGAERVLQRGVHAGAADVAGEYAWGDRRDAVDAVRAGLDHRLDALRSSRVEQGTAYRVAYNQSAAEAWADGNCPGGNGRQFGPCRAIRGVVVQHRAGETVVVAAAFDVTVVSERGTTEVTVVVHSLEKEESPR